MVINNLKKIRMKKGTTHATLKKLLNITQNEIYDIENNIEGNSLYTDQEIINKLCEYFSITEKELFVGTTKKIEDTKEFYVNKNKDVKVLFLDTSTIMNHRYFANKFLKYFSKICITDVVYDEINRHKESGHGVKAEKASSAFRQIEKYKKFIEFDFDYNIKKVTNDEIIYYTAYNHAKYNPDIHVSFVSDDKSHTSRDAKLKNFNILKGKEFDDLVQNIDKTYNAEETKTFWTYLEKGSEASALRMDLESIDLNSMNKDEITPLCFAIIKGYSNLIDALLRRESVDKNIVGCAPNGFGAIHYAVAYNKMAVIRKLESSGAYLDLLTKYSLVNNVTPLMIAASNGNAEILRFLLDSGVSVNQQDSDGNTALHKAAANYQIKTYTILIEEDSDQNIINNDYDRADEIWYEMKNRD